MDVAPPKFPHPSSCDRLRRVLAAADYSERGVVETLGGEQIHGLSSQDLPVLLWRTRGATPRDTLVRLLLVGAAVEPQMLEQAIAPMTVEEWVAMGLVQPHGTSIAATVQMLPTRGMLWTYDRPQEIATGLAPNYVMGVAGSSLTLANLTIRRPSRATLDLGTGCGFQAILAAAHSKRVLAVDRNARAVAYAEFNARLNGLDNVVCLEGDLFAPVQGEQFDLVVSNPPFVLSPERSYIYRDSGMHGDSITQSIVRQVPSFLREGGYCQILCNWAHVAGQDWRDRLGSWFEGTGCDAWILRTDTLDAAAYAAKWIRHTERDAAERFQQRFDAWMDYYREAQIEAVSGGAITLRRRAAVRNWFSTEDGPEKMLGPAGDAILRTFEVHDFLESDPDPFGSHQQFRIAPEAGLQQRFVPSAEGWQLAHCELRLQRALAYAGELDAYIAALVGRCDGSRTLGELEAELAQSLGRDADSIRPAFAGIVRRLVERGFLLPVALVASAGAIAEPNSH